jgi:hypothetical protein
MYVDDGDKIGLALVYSNQCRYEPVDTINSRFQPVSKHDQELRIVLSKPGESMKTTGRPSFGWLILTASNVTRA